MKILLKVFVSLLAATFLVAPAAAEEKTAVAAVGVSEGSAPAQYEVADNYAYKKRFHRGRGKRHYKKKHRRRGRSFYYHKNYKRGYYRRPKPKHYYEKRHHYKKKKHYSQPFYFYDNHFYGRSVTRSYASYNAGSFCFGGSRYKSAGNSYTLRLRKGSYVDRIGFHAHDNIGRKHDAKLSIRTDDGFIARGIDVKKRGQYHEYRVKDRVRYVTLYVDNDDEVCIKDLSIYSR